MGCGSKRSVNDRRVAPDFAQRRMAKCGICKHNQGGVCELVKERQQNKEALISVGVLMPEAWCPIGEWGQQKEVRLRPGERARCQWCRRFHDEAVEVCSWCRAKMGMEQRNLRKRIGQASWGDPYDTRLHEIRHRPFTSEPVRHLHYFLYPRYEDSTSYHLNKLKSLAHQFNGKKVVCVATGPDTHEGKFRDDIHDIFDTVHYVKNNGAQRELAGFIPVMRHFRSLDENEVICFAHGKGQQEHTHSSPTIMEWCDVMYETCVDNWTDVQEAFTQGYPVSGVFKSIGSFKSTPYKWHYSGAFWWGRSAAMFENSRWTETCTAWWGAESYVGRHWWSDEGHCLFGNGTCGGSLYLSSTWESARNELRQWRETRKVVA